MSNLFAHDHETLEEFVKALAKATEYSSYSCGPDISTYWKEEAKEWAKEFEARDLNLGAKLPACSECFSSRVVHEKTCSMYSVNDERVEKSLQTSGPQCKKCGAFTTKARAEGHGLCMKCELESK